MSATASPSGAGSGVSLTDNMENYILIDIGANLTSKKYSRDLDNVVQRAKNAGVQKIMVTGTSVQGSRDALRLTRLYPSVLYCTVGVHPHDAKSWTEATEAELRALAANPECVAIGECGLDFNRNFSPPETQLEVFEKQVALACELQKPLFVHEREAHSELVSILEVFGKRLPPTVIHCFTGSAQHAAKYLDMGFYIGLTGYVWKDKSEDGVRRMLEDQLIPLDRLLLETDSPFMYPNVRAAKVAQHVKDKLSERALQFLHRYCTFQRNEPCSLAASAEMIAGYMGHSVYDVAMKTTYNAVKLFGLSG